MWEEGYKTLNIYDELQMWEEGYKILNIYAELQRGKSQKRETILYGSRRQKIKKLAWVTLGRGTP